MYLEFVLAKHAAKKTSAIFVAVNFNYEGALQFGLSEAHGSVPRSEVYIAFMSSLTTRGPSVASFDFLPAKPELICYRDRRC